MCTAESEIHPRIKQTIVDSTEHDTVHLFRTMRNTARVYSNAVAREAIAKERAGAKFEEIQHLVSGARGRTVYEKGDPEAGVWSAGITLGLIHDVPSCEELLVKIEKDAILRIQTMSALVQPAKAVSGAVQERQSRL
jgi:NAD(P)H-dependent flavin oxidoreductase YrpB (nitropropane dioxygenase family)